MGCKQSAPVVNAEDAKKQGKDSNTGNINGATCCKTESKSGFTYTKGVCALEYWLPIRLLAEGSISSIHLVRRRPHRVDVPYKERADIMAQADSNKNEEEEEEGELYALKSIMKDHVRNDKYLEEMRSEIHTLSRLCHPNIINVYEAYERKRHIYLIMDFCRGGDLCERKFTEAEAAVIVRDVLSAVSYMHQHNVCHRDIKLENLMFDKKPNLPNALIKVIDLGLATRFLGDEFKNMTDRVGTLYSMAPQVLQGVYDSKCDMWSIGVVVYMLLSGKQPFWGPPREMSWEKRRKVMIDRIMRCEYMKMKGPSWDKISKDAKNFVQSLLQISPDRRPTAEEALKLPWMVKYQNYTKQGVPAAQDVQYTKKQQLKRSALVLLAETLWEDDIVALKDLLIQEYDEHVEDHITVQQFHDALLQTKLSPSQVAALFSDTGLDRTIHMEYLNLLNEALDRRIRKQEEKITNSLQDKETDLNCKISKEKLRELLANEVSISSLGVIFEGDDNEEISCQQVLENMRSINLKKFDLMCSCREDAFGDDDEDLVGASDAVIPGGRNDPSERPKYVYDDTSKSMRPCAAGEDLSVVFSSPCCK